LDEWSKNMTKFVFLLLVSLSHPCEFEDSQNCYWNAAERGNGVGQSFINVDDVVLYPDWRTSSATKRPATP
jgi:hypothetical protein